MPTAMFNSSVAYFSMEICLEQGIPTYSGGLGVLAGDTLRSAADLEIPMVGVTLLHRKGYFQQHIDADGNQTERPVEWQPEKLLERLDVTVTVTSSFSSNCSGRHSTGFSVWFPSPSICCWK